MDPEDTYSIAGLKENLATCIEKVAAGRIVYVQNHKRRGNPTVAALVSPRDARHLEATRTDAAATP